MISQIKQILFSLNCSRTRPKTLVLCTEDGTMWMEWLLSVEAAEAMMHLSIDHTYLRKVSQLKNGRWIKFDEYKWMKCAYEPKGHKVIAGGTYKRKYDRTSVQKILREVGDVNSV